ncbi:MAG: hypothetical protein L3J28_14600 [Candidatus Polarisedimenticolaceae bacterium]|nr:hypothetical protein [Candidatus Polarisedimenticolaceae bacterium]
MKITVYFNRLSPFWFGMAVLTMLVILVGIGVATWQFFENPKAIQGHLEAAKPYLFGWRMLLLGTLITLWPHLMAWFGQHSNWSSEKLNFAISWRWRAALWLLVVEVGLIQGVIGTFLRYLFQD